MMFALRGIAVSFSIFVLVYGALSAGVCGVWWSVCHAARQVSARRRAGLLFALRVAPFVVATGITLALAVPSFLLLEPRTGNEPTSKVVVVLGLCGIAVLLAGMWKAAAALTRTSRAIARWSGQARIIGSLPVDSRDSVSVLRISATAPPLTAAGILRPSVWLSRAAELVLTEQELE
ncbi:MAG: hypothetical protein WAM69_17630, partial [Candidatus Sulfotelmatobacter sp.]